MLYPIAARRRIAFTAALFLAAAAALGAWPLHVLLIEDVPGTRPVLVQRVQPGQQFSLGFLHSVENCRVWDHLTISPTYEMVVVSTEFAESRTGLPYAAFGGEIFENRGDHFRIRNMHRPVPEIYQWVDARYENTLCLDGRRDIALASLAGKTLLHMRIVTMSTARWGWLKAKLYWHRRSF
ncbi:MAG: DUF1850 domain-containing protein [Desulfobacterales bacterium]|nr:DUF1850 domain-containing protein [Desulfobacterales bacterium]